MNAIERGNDGFALTSHVRRDGVARYIYASVLVPATSCHLGFRIDGNDVGDMEMDGRSLERLHHLMGARIDVYVIPLMATQRNVRRKRKYTYSNVAGTNDLSMRHFQE